MISKSLVEKYLCCPGCFTKVTVRNRRVICGNCHSEFMFFDGDIPSMILGSSIDTEFSMNKWEKTYLRKSYIKEAERVYKKYFGSTKKQVLEFVRNSSLNRKPLIYLEIGCGLGFLGEELAKNGWFFIGVDFSKSALRILKSRLEKHGVRNYLLIHGDVQKLPIKDEAVDLIFGGGVIEHLKNTQLVVDHLYRVLKKGGVTFNSVPYFNLGNLIYRSRWGGIPNVPILKQIAEIVHIKILGGRYMVFGYELQFTAGQLISFHRKAGFKNKDIFIDRFDSMIQLYGIKNKVLRKFLVWLCTNNRLFWPAIKVIAIKS